MIVLNKKNLIIVHKNNLIKKPKISVIIPVYNGGKYLSYSLKSVQNQKMKDIEIIIINDNSSDDSLKIIQNYMKNDKRIRLINNIENRRILFCKSFGALNSKGKYIVELDQDDIFIGDDVLNMVYKQSENNELDMLHFDYIASKNILQISNKDRLKIFFNSLFRYKYIIYKQPRLKFTLFKTNIIVLWGNLIKTDLYKKVIYNLWPIIINYKIIFQEDFLITFFLLIYAQKYKKINDILYFYFLNQESASDGYKNNIEYYLSIIFAGIIFYDYYIDSHSKDFQIILNYISFSKKELQIAQRLYPTLFIYFFEKILTNNCLSIKNKKDIMNNFNIKGIGDSYKYLNNNQLYFLNAISSYNIIDIPRRKNELIKLSLIIIYSNHEKIIKLINSINKQNTQYLEVILIYDDKNKKDYYLLLNFVKSYKYIKLIFHENKKGTIYSISESLQIAKGKYLLFLNSNCFFLSDDVLDKIYEVIEEEFDIFEFNLYKILPNNYTNLYKCKHFESQFNLTQIKYNSEFNNIDIKNELLTNKLIKTKFFVEILKSYKFDQSSTIIDYFYNNLFSFIIDSNFHKYKYVSSFDIYIYDSDMDKPEFNYFTSIKRKLVEETIFYIDFIFKYSKCTYESKEKVIKEFFNYLSIVFNKFTKISDSSLNLLNKFMNCKYISKSNKDLLKLYYISLTN